MRRYLLFLIFVLSFCFTSGAEARKLALLVGVDEYDGVSSLQCCVNDMNTLKEALMKIEFKDNDIQMLVTGGAYKNFPTKKKIEQKVSELLSKAQPDDIVFIALSGHGAQDGKNVYFCPPDVEIDDLEGSCVSINKIMDDLANCNAKFKWMVVDACRNDPTQGPKGIGGKGLQVIPTPPMGIALFQSCAEGEESWEDRDSGNGYFTKNFAAALSGEADGNGDGKLTLMEVCSWTTDQTKEQVKSSKNKTQRPYFSGTISDFTLTEDLNVPKAQALVEEARKAVEEEKYELAIQKFDDAIAMCPRFDSWKRERTSAQRLLDKSKFNSMNIVVPDNFPTIEDAYNNVKDGGIITIQPGKYELSATLVVNRPVTFRGSTGRPEDIVIECPSSHAFQIDNGSPSFQNLTVVSGGEESGSFFITGGEPKLFRCILTSRKGRGIFIQGEKANPKVESCTIKNCGKAGVLIQEKGLGAFTDCDIFGNTASGIAVKESGAPTFVSAKPHGQVDEVMPPKEPVLAIPTSNQEPTFVRCKIHDGKASGVKIFENGLGTFTDCEIYANAFSGIEIKESGNPSFTSCKVHDGKLCGVYVHDNGLGKFTDCEIYANAYSGIEVKESGNPTFVGCKIYNGKQSGVKVHTNGLGSFSDCKIYGNEGAGINVISSGAPTVTDCEIYSNANSGIQVCDYGAPVVARCKIHDGKSAGAFIFENGRGSFTDCEIYSNAYSGIEVRESGDPTVTGCKIHDGKQSGVKIHLKGMGTFNNNTLEKNYLKGQLSNWNIQPTAGTVKGSGNTPPIPAKGTRN